MKNIQFNLVYFILGFIVFSCSSPKPDVEDYRTEVEKWKKERLRKLTSPQGWTTVVGLQWLKEGNNSFGSDETNAIQFPAFAPQEMGSIFLGEDSLSVAFKEGLDIVLDSAVVPTAKLKTDQGGKPSLMNWKSLYWFVLKRKDRYGVRIRDTLAENRMKLKEIPYFPIDPNWKVLATFKKVASDRTIMMENVLGMSIDYPLEGIVEFTYNNQQHEILALDGGEKELFLIIADQSSGESTYGGGRYMYIPRPDIGGQTHVDFNKAYNPPCNFTKYATCLLPPSENYLPFAIRAGEKTYEQH